MAADNEKLYAIRHSLAHLLAIAVRMKDPGAKRAIGPVIDDGFYYDFEFSKKGAVTEDDFKELEKNMRALINRGIPFERIQVSADNAREQFKDQPYKLELIEEFAREGMLLTLYKTGDFIDLCRGGHVENTQEIDPKSFKLSRMAGAYWRGDEKNTMLSRIYGLAFATEADLDAHMRHSEEAKKRDHRKLGRELDLFTFSELVGPGLPLWTPRGTIIRELLNDYVWELRKARGYQKVTIPHITKKELYETSGHWAKFSDELFKIETREGKLFALKPMNCPHHTQIYASSPKSYRDMPVRFCETTMVYRDEQSGELSGLSRVLAITQDDAHVFARKSHIKQEMFAIWDIIDSFYGTFGFTDIAVRFSRHDPQQFEKYLGTREIWDEAERQIRALLNERGIAAYLDGNGEAAMYGPKIDFITTDSIGRTIQVATIQLDFNQPNNFDLFCINEKGEKERIVMIHCAIMGSLERFIAMLIEHTSGIFPFWLAPEQIRILPISDAHRAYAEEMYMRLHDAGFRAMLDDSDESLGKKIRNGRMMKIPYMLVIGEKEVEAKMVTVESRDIGNKGQMSIGALVEKLAQENNNRMLGSIFA